MTHWRLLAFVTSGGELGRPCHANVRALRHVFGAQVYQLLHPMEETAACKLPDVVLEHGIEYGQGGVAA